LKSIASAPAKIILFGEHFVVHGTDAILAAIDKRVTVTTTFTDNKTIKVNSQLGTIEVPIDQSWGERPFAWRQGKPYDKEFPKIPKEITDLGTFAPFVYLARMFWDLMRERKKHQWADPVFDKSGLEITIDSDIPVGVGLGSSSASCVAATASITNLFIKSGFARQSGYYSTSKLELVLLIDGDVRWKTTREFIQTKAIMAERTIFPDTSGADCEICTNGGCSYHCNRNYGEPAHWHMGCDLSDINLVIANSMTPHSTKDSVERVKRFKENNEERFSQLCELEMKLIRVANSVLYPTSRTDYTLLGEKMSENQKYLEEIQVSNNTLYGMIHSLKEISLGTKITGAGDGGCIIALVKDENMDKVPELLGKDKECFSAKIDRKGVVWEIEK
jgi:mevalonate kinase